MAAAKTEQERDNISHNYRTAGDPFYNYFPSRIESAEGGKKVIVSFKAGKQVTVGDLLREGKVEHRAKLARHRAEDVAAARKAEHASRLKNAPSAPVPASAEDRAPAPDPGHAPAVGHPKFEAQPVTASAVLYVPPATKRPFKKPITLGQKKRSPLRRTPSPGKITVTEVAPPMDVANKSPQNEKTPEVAPPHLEAETQKTPTFIDLVPENEQSQNDGGFISELPVPMSQPYFDLTGDDNRGAESFVDWAKPWSPGTKFHTTTMPRRTID